ncbi:site-specific DNA-methyltransferase [Ovoidimarina sediminis]|uniref:site-specific DNA-methyltransferase n=1 Tax=Ovoidimarina sediminis TaxID=3079856 RepID=UPI00290A3DD9|nr:DNA methyltransferase [Rhodophyticola sp. MJ-SS7]MDU8945989.1 DNA methyltransferase [Rhodophyticola sp. MJ-SS7]
MADLKITYRSPDDLSARARNPRTHSEAQIRQLMRSIEHFGFTNPVLVDSGSTLVAGHGRVLAAQRLGMKEVPVICLEDMSPADIQAYVIADNRLAENAGWDRELLALEFADLGALGIDYDLTLTGFELPEIDLIIQDQSLAGPDSGSDPADETPDVSDGPSVTRPWDIWEIGRHRLICGDSTKRDTYLALMGETRAQMVFTDPPYNVPVSGHVCGSGRVQHREFAMASGEMSPEAFTSFLSGVFHHLAEFSADGSLHFQCMDWRHMREILEAGAEAYSELKNLCVWSKANAGMGSLYRSQHELVFAFKSGRGAHINNVELGKHGRYRTNVWTYPGVNSFGAQQKDLDLHPTVKPTALVRDAILDCSRREGLILDAFCGSGTTLIAAEETGRSGRGIEIDPAYCDVIVRRLRDVCGLKARLQATGQSFEDVAEVRATDDAEDAE